MAARATRVPDDPAKVAASIAQALGVADVVLTIGGVSAGEFDPVKLSLGAIEGVAWWRVAMKPGRPQAFGRPRGRLRRRFHKQARSSTVSFGRLGQVADPGAR